MKWPAVLPKGSFVAVRRTRLGVVAPDTSKTRVGEFYSNRVAVVLEQPVNNKFPLGPKTSAIPAELYSSPFESIDASWVIFVQPV